MVTARAEVFFPGTSCPESGHSCLPPKEQTRSPTATSVTPVLSRVTLTQCPPPLPHHCLSVPPEHRARGWTQGGGRAHPPGRRGRACPPSPPCNAGAEGREGGRGEGSGRLVIEVGWNNKYTHSLLNMARHILGNLEKRSASPARHPPSHPRPRQQFAFMRLGSERARPFDSRGLVQGFESFQTVFYFRSSKFIKVQIGGGGRKRGKGERRGWGQLVVRRAASDLGRIHRA